MLFLLHQRGILDGFELLRHLELGHRWLLDRNSAFRRRRAWRQGHLAFVWQVVQSPSDVERLHGGDIFDRFDQHPVRNERMLRPFEVQPDKQPNHQLRCIDWHSAS